MDNSVNQGRLCSNVNTADIDEATTAKLKGDTIGDTLYSQSFVIKTLLQFSHLKWDEKIEEDLSFLWDMTVDKEVCEYLFQLSFPSLACDVIMKNSENRLIEILVGILANLMCSECEKNMKDEEIKIVLLELNSDDPLVLIQVMRFISAIAHSCNNLTFITEEIFVKIVFILNNSVNAELILKTLGACVKLTESKINKKLVNLDFYLAILVAYNTVVSDSNYDFDINENLLYCKYMLENVRNICSYIEYYDNEQLLLEIQRNSHIFVNETKKLLDYFRQEENMFPVSDDFMYLISILRYTLITLNISYCSELFISIMTILCSILNMQNEFQELFDSILEMVCFLLSVGTRKDLIKDLSQLSRNQVKVVLNMVNENKHKYEFNLNIQDLMHKYR